MKPILRGLLLCLLFLSGPTQAAEDLLDPEVAFRFSARLKDPRTVEIRYDIAKGYYMYRDNFRFAIEGAQAGKPVIPAGKKKFDANFQKTMEIHRGAVTILLPVSGGAGPITLKSTSQGCADAGVCYPPITQNATFTLVSADASASAVVAASIVAPAKRAHAAGFARVASSAELDAALRAGQRVAMLDFYADWCSACKQMERLTFSDPRVKQRLAALAPLQADVTRNNADDQVLLKRFKLVGLPGIIFFDKSGKEIPALRVIGYQPPEKFLVTLDKAARF